VPSLSTILIHFGLPPGWQIDKVRRLISLHLSINSDGLALDLSCKHLSCFCGWCLAGLESIVVRTRPSNLNLECTRVTLDLGPSNTAANQNSSIQDAQSPLDLRQRNPAGFKATATICCHLHLSTGSACHSTKSPRLNSEINVARRVNQVHVKVLELSRTRDVPY